MLYSVNVGLSKFLDMGILMFIVIAIVGQQAEKHFYINYLRPGSRLF